LQAHFDTADIREFQCIAQQVVDNLAQSISIQRDHRRWVGRAIELE